MNMLQPDTDSDPSGRQREMLLRKIRQTCFGKCRKLVLTMVRDGAKGAPQGECF